MKTRLAAWMTVISLMGTSAQALSVRIDRRPDQRQYITGMKYRVAMDGSRKAWVEIETYYPDAGFAFRQIGQSDPETPVPGLSFDPAQTTVLFAAGALEVVCATVKTAPEMEITPSGHCTVHSERSYVHGKSMQDTYFDVDETLE
jgi:hypothetical protein